VDARTCEVGVMPPSSLWKREATKQEERSKQQAEFASCWFLRVLIVAEDRAVPSSKISVNFTGLYGITLQKLELLMIFNQCKLCYHANIHPINSRVRHIYELNRKLKGFLKIFLRSINLNL
jgi:hypothetical protein